MRAAYGLMAALTLVIASAGCGAFFARSHPDLNLITREEIEQNRFHNAYEAVAALHANWLVRKPKSPSNNGLVGVMLDQNRMSVGDLTAIDAQRIQYIRYWDPTSATERWGVGHTNGVIQVSTQAR